MIVFNALQTSLNGGIGRYSYELAKELYLINDGNVKIVVRKEDMELFKFAKMEDLIIAENISNSRDRNIYEQFKLPFIVNKKYPDAILHYPDSMAPLFAKNKVVITVHDIAFKTMKNIFTFKSKIWKSIITNFSIKKAEKIIAISEFTKKEMIDVYGKKVASKVVVVLNGFNDFSKDKINTNNISSKILELEKEKYILTVSTISPRKNIDGLIKAYNECNFKDEFKLVIAGANGWMYEEVFKVVKDLNIQEKIVFTGRINDDELKYLYKNSKIFAYVSFYEGFGLPPIEAMSYGIPCIVSNVSSLPEVVGDAAIMINPKETKQISEAIDLLAKDSYIFNKYSTAGKLNAKRFSWNKCAKESSKVY